MDALSYMLQTVQLRTTIYGTVRLRPPWGVRIPRGDAAAFHAIVAGRCWFQLEGADAPIALTRGDVVVLPHGDPHTFCDDPRSPVRSIEGISDASVAPRLPRAALEELDSDPSSTAAVCGHLWFDDRAANPLVSLLPPLILFHAATGGRPAGWLDPMLQFVVSETDAQAPGADAVLARLSEMIVVLAIRTYLTELPLGGHGWLRALADSQLGAALGLIHQHPETPWTVARLATQVGISRSSFAARFAHLIGESPLRYVARWRMHRAQRLLRGSNAGLAEIAARVGYQTEFAFSRAFKRRVGVAPSVFRRTARAVVQPVSR